MVSNKQIILYFFGSTKGIKGTAAYFGLPKSYVGSVINRYKRLHSIR